MSVFTWVPREKQESTVRAYHGSSTAVISDATVLRAPEDTGVLQEQGRKKRLNCIFSTPNEGLARIYAGRAVRRFGGRPVILTVSLPERDTIVDPGSKPGATIYVSPGAWIVKKQLVG